MAGISVSITQGKPLFVSNTLMAAPQQLKTFLCCIIMFVISYIVPSNFCPILRYVLLHHVMAQVCGVKGAWGYPEGGMGGVTQAMARAATEAGAHLYTSKVLWEC